MTLDNTEVAAMEKGDASQVTLTSVQPRQRVDKPTALMTACQRQNIEQIRELTASAKDSDNQTSPRSSTSDLSAQDATGKTALHFSVENVSTEPIELILACDKTLIDVQDDSGHTALHLASVAGNAAIAECLLRLGANVNMADKDRHTAAHWATACGQADVIELLSRYKADLELADAHGATPLHYAAQLSAPPSSGPIDDQMSSTSTAMTTTRINGLEVVDRLLSLNVQVDCRDEDQRTPLLWAASAGSATACDRLIQAKAQIEAADKDGLTALHCAASKGHMDCVTSLLSHGAKVDSVDQNGCTPLFYAATLGRTNVIEKLADSSANVDHQDERGRSTVHCAAGSGHVDCLQVLKEKSTDMWQRNKRSEFPVHEAALKGHIGAVQFLLEECKPQKKDTNKKNKSRASPVDPDNLADIGNREGRTCLHIAAQTDNLPLAIYLVEQQNASKTVVWKYKGKQLTPYEVAFFKNNTKCAEYLKPVTKDPNSSGKQPEATKTDEPTAENEENQKDEKSEEKDAKKNNEDEKSDEKSSEKTSSEDENSTGKNGKSDERKPENDERAASAVGDKSSSTDEKPLASGAVEVDSTGNDPQNGGGDSSKKGDETKKSNGEAGDEKPSKVDKNKTAQEKNENSAAKSSRSAKPGSNGKESPEDDETTENNDDQQNGGNDQNKSKGAKKAGNKSGNQTPADENENEVPSEKGKNNAAKSSRSANPGSNGKESPEDDETTENNDDQQNGGNDQNKSKGANKAGNKSGNQTPADEKGKAGVNKNNDGTPSNEQESSENNRAKKNPNENKSSAQADDNGDGSKKPSKSGNGKRGDDTTSSEGNNDIGEGTPSKKRPNKKSGAASGDENSPKQRENGGENDNGESDTNQVKDGKKPTSGNNRVLDGGKSDGRPDTDSSSSTPVSKTGGNSPKKKNGGDGYKSASGQRSAASKGEKPANDPRSGSPTGAQAGNRGKTTVNDGQRGTADHGQPSSSANPTGKRGKGNGDERSVQSGKAASNDQSKEQQQPHMARWAASRNDERYAGSTSAPAARSGGQGHIDRRPENSATPSSNDSESRPVWKPTGAPSAGLNKTRPKTVAISSSPTREYDGSPSRRRQTICPISESEQRTLRVYRSTTLVPDQFLDVQPAASQHNSQRQQQQQPTYEERHIENYRRYGLEPSVVRGSEQGYDNRPGAEGSRTSNGTSAFGGRQTRHEQQGDAASSDSGNTRPPTSPRPRASSSYKNHIQEQVRIFEIRRMAAMELEKARRFRFQSATSRGQSAASAERNHVRHLTNDFNTNTAHHRDHRIDDVTRLNEFETILHGKLSQLSIDEARLKRLEKINSLYGVQDRGKKQPSRSSGGSLPPVQQSTNQQQRLSENGRVR